MIVVPYATHLRATLRPRKGAYGTRFRAEVRNTVTGKVILTDDGWKDHGEAMEDVRVMVQAARLAWFFDFRQKDLKR